MPYTVTSVLPPLATSFTLHGSGFTSAKRDLGHVFGGEPGFRHVDAYTCRSATARRQRCGPIGTRRRLTDCARRLIDDRHLRVLHDRAGLVDYDDDHGRSIGRLRTEGYDRRDEVTRTAATARRIEPNLTGSYVYYQTAYP